MQGILWVIAGATVVFAGVVSYFVTRRYGWGAAVVLPAVALAAMIAMTWQEEGLDAAAGMELVRESLLFAAPVLGGVLVGILVARRRG
jgi:hypothetical protein